MDVLLDALRYQARQPHQEDVFTSSTDAHKELLADASEPGDVRCGIPGFDHPGTELHGDTLRSTDPALRWQVTGRRHAAFTTDFDYRSSP